ncbi:endo-1,4-beta-xylanase [Leeuwenhoekiella parthenopeia]|uniref:Beta-xylanase n=1 Tax=Leeuwenhoekiella parthenopeia TaxID=2890320 RepID=A0ABS8GV02_9FLAO|nr:endo-1,4-beta-xylanase [Leeuwenhoekiella parthenopeia]MCC4213626.1 endo-1,4-beta-xylanase [Leeuwenhoekiella parthenopeia]
MKNIHFRIIPAAVLALCMASCADMEMPEFDVEKPLSIQNQEAINGLQNLKTYVANPNFKLGAGIGIGTYNNLGPMYLLANTNFQELTAGYAMKHGAVVLNDGSLSLDAVSQFVENTARNEVSIYGHTLAWHANQNATFLNSTIAPVEIPSQSLPDWEVILDKSFETDDASGYQSNGANAILGFTADGAGFNNTGRALKVTNPAVQTDDWRSQLFVTFSRRTAVGDKYRLEVDVRADANANMGTQAQTSPGGYKHWNFFGAVAAQPQWKHISVEVTIADNTSNCNTIAFNLGNTATTYYFDNLKVSWFNDEATGSTFIERTPEEKRDTLTYHLDKWISGIMEVSKSNTHAWDVVNEPMDDGNPYELKTGIGKTKAADEFYWQDYLGKDYGVVAFKMAEMYGNPDDILFINDYNLEYNLDKCKGIIEYVKYIEEKGARVDGIGTQMHISLDSDKGKITEMFKLLAATGKMIKISELDIGVGVQTTEATEELYLAQEEMYRFVLEQYFTLVPQAQQYGITIWSPTDSPANSSWRAGEPIGLWTQGFTRKPAYRGVVEGLGGNVVN